ncbi:MAG TPA: hypothetical protein PK335_03045 [Draconibacterium sp.]|nr:hypothetical protein [Draconibacterium sp.]
MKKLLFVLAFVAAYSVSMAKTQAPVVAFNQTVVVADEGKNNLEKEKEKKEAKSDAKTEAKAENKSAGCGGEKEVKADATKSHDCGGEKKAEAAKTEKAKTGGCGGN